MRLPGVALPCLADHYWSLAQSIGRPQAALWWRLAGQGAEAVRQLMTGQTAPDQPQATGVGSCALGSVMHLAVNPTEASEMSQGLRWMKEDGLECRMMGGAAASNYAPVLEPDAALFLPGAAVFDPSWWHQLLLSKLLESGVQCFTSDAEWKLDGTVVASPDHRLTAETIILANGLGATRWLGVQRPWLFPLRGQSQLSEPIRQGLRSSLVAVTANRGHEVYRDWAGGFVVAGINPGAGSHELTEELEVDMEFCQQLDNYAGRRISELLQVQYTHRWATIYDYTMDGLPLIGTAAGQSRVWLAAGFAGSEWSLGAGAGIELARILGGQSSSLEHLPSASARRFS